MYTFLSINLSIFLLFGKHYIVLNPLGIISDILYAQEFLFDFYAILNL